MAQQHGYTLLELLMSIALMSLLLVTAGAFFSSNLQAIWQEDTRNALSDNTRTAIQTVATVIRSARSVEAANAQGDNNAPGAPSNLYSWAASAGSGATLILAIPSRDAAGNLIYSDGLHNNLYTDDEIYYIDSPTHRLYRRLIANSQAPGNAAKTTCPPAIATSSCPADARIVDDVANLTTQYFDANYNPISSPTGTEAVQITLTQTRSAFGKTLTNSFTTTASLRNR